MCIGGFEGGGSGLPFEFLTGVFDLGFDLIETVGGVLENQWNEEGSDEGGNTIFGGGDFTFEDGRGILSGGGHWKLLNLVKKSRNSTNFTLFTLNQIAQIKHDHVDTRKTFGRKFLTLNTLTYAEFIISALFREILCVPRQKNIPTSVINEALFPIHKNRHAKRVQQIFRRNTE